VGAGRRPETEHEAPRVRDMPAPRKSEGAAGGAMQRIFAWPYRGILAFLLWTGVRPWQLTLLSLGLNVAVGALIITGDWFLAGVLLVLAGLSDVFDGSVARQRGEEKRSGAFLDSVLDRLSDAILFSCLFWALAASGQQLEAALALITLVVSLSVSHVRAEAEAVGVSLTEGFFQRLERFLALIAGLVVPGAMRPVLIVLTVLGGITLLQRAWSAVQDAR
jgi:CDP-diacylglycerol--glycerol-3-phosphate 3-phosphatidyltransferase